MPIWGQRMSIWWFGLSMLWGRHDVASGLCPRWWCTQLRNRERDWVLLMWDSLSARGVVLWLLGVGDVYFEIAGDRLGLSAQHGAVG